MSLLFNTLSRFILLFFPRRKHLLISWLQSPSTVILEPEICHFPLYLLSSDYSWKWKSITKLCPTLCDAMYCVALRLLCPWDFPGLVQSLSCVRLIVTPWTAACQASLSVTNSWSLLRLMSIESVMPSNHLILCPRLIPCKWKSDVVQNFILRVALFSHTFSNVCILFLWVPSQASNSINI